MEKTILGASSHAGAQRFLKELTNNDAVFGVRRSLVAKVEPYKAEKAGNLTLERKPDAMLHFDFVLAPEG